MNKLTVLVCATLALLIILMLLICFFQFPSFDDYVAIYFRRKFGTEGSISWYLTYLNGRFSTIPVYLIICGSLSLMTFYPWLLLIFILLSIASIHYFVRYFSRYLFLTTNRQYNWLITAMILIFFLGIVPEISTLLYWLSTSITYLLPLSAFFLFLVSWCWLFSTKGFRKWYPAVAICLLMFFLGGSNEIMMYFSFAFPFLTAIVLLAARHKLPVQLPVIMLSAFLMAALVLYMPGNHVRTENFTQVQPFRITMIGSAFRTWQLLLILFRNPMFYISSIGVVLLSAYLKPSVLEFFSRKKTSWLFELFCLITLFWGFDIMIRQYANRILPLRATNILVCLFLLGCWWIIIMNAGKLPKIATIIRANSGRMKQWFFCIFLFSVLGSAFFKDLISNMILLPVHASVLREREQLIRDAKAAGRSSVYLPPYEKEMTTRLQSTFKGKTRFVKEEFKMPPSFAFFMDEPYKHDFAYFYAEYHNIDTVIVDSASYIRWGLSNEFPNDRSFDGY